MVINASRPRQLTSKQGQPGGPGLLLPSPQWVLVRNCAISAEFQPFSSAGSRHIYASQADSMPRLAGTIEAMTAECERARRRREQVACVSNHVLSCMNLELRSGGLHKASWQCWSCSHVPTTIAARLGNSE